MDLGKPVREHQVMPAEEPVPAKEAPVEEPATPTPVEDPVPA